MSGDPRQRLLTLMGGSHVRVAAEATIAAAGKAGRRTFVGGGPRATRR